MSAAELALHAAAHVWPCEPDIGAADAKARVLRPVPARSAALVRSAGERSRVKSQDVCRLRVRPTSLPNLLLVLPRRQVHLFRALACNSTQERVGFSLHVDDLLSLGQALVQRFVLLAKFGDLYALRVGLPTAFGFERGSGSALLAPVGDVRGIDVLATANRRPLDR